MARVRDENRMPELIKELQSLDKLKVQIGIVAPSGDKLYMIGWVHEFGFEIHVTEKMRGWFLAQGMPLREEITKIRIPERSYFRTGYDRHKASIEQKAITLIDKVLQGEMAARQARDELGEFVSSKIQANIEDVQLVKTGALRDAIGHRVVYK